MTYYASPAAANYYTPPPHVVRQRATRMCDQCGAIEQPAIKQFRLCGGCVRSTIFLRINKLCADQFPFTSYR